nr:hypothetical protein [Tanacetum cinerariifolium]
MADKSVEVGKPGNVTSEQVVQEPSVVPSITMAYDNTQKDLNDDPVAMEVQSPLVDQTNVGKTGRGSYLPLPTQGTTLAGNTFVESIRAISESSTDGLNSMLENGPWFIHNHSLILQKWNPDVDLMKEDIRNVPVLVKLHGVPITAFSEDGLSAIAMKLGTLLMADSYISDMCLQSLGRSSYVRVMIELRADVKLKDTIVVAMPKIMREGYYMCTIHVEYKWKPARHVLKKPTASSSGNKKKGVEPTNEVSNSNPFYVLNSVDNDVKLGTNGGNTNLVNSGGNLSGSSFMNVENSSTSNTPISDKIRKFKDLLISRQAILMDEDGNPLKKVKCPGDYDSEDEVASFDNDITHSMASERVGFDTQSLLEQWRDNYGNGDYDEDPYDDDMYEGQDLPQEIQAICDNLDIRV